MGAGFIVTPSEATALGYGRSPDLTKRIRKYLNARDIGTRSRGVNRPGFAGGRLV